MSEKLMSISSLDQLTEGWRTWNSDSSLRSVLRFGQYMWNKYGLPDKRFPRLFYANTSDAYKILVEEVQKNQEKTNGPNGGG